MRTKHFLIKKLFVISSYYLDEVIQATEQIKKDIENDLLNNITIKDRFDEILCRETTEPTKAERSKQLRKDAMKWWKKLGKKEIENLFIQHK
jgi:hypothetical protein